MRRLLLIATLLAAPDSALAASPTTSLSALSGLKVGGSLALNWRNVGPREPGFEQQIQNEVFLSDIFFGAGGKIGEKLPVVLEFHIPTGDQGRVILNQFHLDHYFARKWRFQAGKFLVPFGRFNELYRADEFLPATRPLTHASPDSLDLVVRLNSPRPPLTAGFADVGARFSYYPETPSVFVPVELDFYVINGIGEFENRQRTFPSPGNLNIPPIPQQGTTPDFGHQNNNLADNNNNKTAGGRAVFALGDLRLPWPLSGTGEPLRGANLGLSVMHGRYDLESNLDNTLLGVETSFQYGDLRFTIEGVWNETDFRTLTLDSSQVATVPANTRNIPIDTEIHRGFYVQAVFPLMTDPRWGEKTLGMLEYDFLERRGPHMEFSSNGVLANNLPIPAKLFGDQRITTKIMKYVATVNHRLNDYLWAKAEFAYWDIFVPNIGGVPQTDVYQSIFTVVVGF